MTGTKNTKILIVDDHPLVRLGLRLSLATEASNFVVGEARNGNEGLALLKELEPDVMLLDLDMPGLSTTEVIAQALQTRPDLRVLIFTSHERPDFYEQIRHFKIAGYLLKTEPSEHLLQAVRSAHAGKTWISRSIQDRLTQKLPPSIRLTPREKVVVRMLHLSNKEIAAHLGIATQTVRNYTSTIFEKIGTNSRVEASFWASENGLFPMDFFRTPSTPNSHTRGSSPLSGLSLIRNGAQLD